ncbi:MAG: hypothetical protein ACP5FL_09180 [Thermoplasmatota archaeon]
MKYKFTILLVVLLFGVLHSPMIYSQPIEGPHPIHGHIYLGNDTPCDNFTVSVTNMKTSDIIENKRIFKKDNYYQLDVGKPGPSWHYGHTVSIRAECTLRGVTYTGETTILLKKNTSSQTADILLYPPAPSSPTVSGPIRGITNISYLFSLSAIDHNNLNVSIGVDWNNDTQIDAWSHLLDPKEQHWVSHSWNTSGRYSIRFIAKNRYGAFSNWTTWVIHIQHDQVVELLYPSKEAKLDGECQILWNATCQNITLHYGIKDEGWKTIITNMSNTGKYSWDTTSYTDGNYKIRLSAFDVHGKVGEDVVPVSIDNTDETPDFLSVTVIFALLVIALSIRKKNH